MLRLDLGSSAITSLFNENHSITCSSMIVQDDSHVTLVPSPRCNRKFEPKRAKAHARSRVLTSRSHENSSRSRRPHKHGHLFSNSHLINFKPHYFRTATPARRSRVRLRHGSRGRVQPASEVAVDITAEHDRAQHQVASVRARLQTLQDHQAVRLLVRKLQLVLSISPTFKLSCAIQTVASGNTPYVSRVFCSCSKLHRFCYQESAAKVGGVLIYFNLRCESRGSLVAKFSRPVVYESQSRLQE